MKWFFLLMISLCAFQLQLFAQDSVWKVPELPPPPNNLWFQEESDFDMGISYAQTKVGSQTVRGFGVDVMSWITNKLATGLSVDYMYSFKSNDFRNVVTDPALGKLRLQMANEFKLLQYKKIYFGAQLRLGWSTVALRNNEDICINCVLDESTPDPNDSTCTAVEKLVARNNFFTLTPAVLFRYRFSKHTMFEAHISRDYNLGHPQFGRREDFENFVIRIGLRFEDTIN